MLLFPNTAANAAARWKVPPAGVVRNNHPASAWRAVQNVSVFAVDDTLDLTHLYAVLLTEAGYTVRSFNDRATALAALRTERNKPNLLITDCLGLSMSVEEFMDACRAVHPAIRILMASGFHRTHARFSNVRPDRFILKPFTPEEFLAEVRAALTA